MVLVMARAVWGGVATGEASGTTRKHSFLFFFLYFFSYSVRKKSNV